MAKFVEAYAKDTGEKHWVPERFLSHPVLGANLSRTPPKPATTTTQEPAKPGKKEA